LKEVAILTQVILEALANGDHPGDLAVLSRYQDWTHPEQRHTIGFTQALVKLFSMQSILIGLLSSSSLGSLDLFPAAKQQFTHRLVGLSGKQPRWATMGLV